METQRRNRCATDAFRVDVSAAQSPQTFETALAELEGIVASMEDGQLPLKESLAAYKRGAELLTYCQASLKDAQHQVEVLEQGVLKAFEPDEAFAPEKPADSTDAP